MESVTLDKSHELLQPRFPLGYPESVGDGLACLSRGHPGEGQGEGRGGAGLGTSRPGTR